MIKKIYLFWDGGCTIISVVGPNSVVRREHLCQSDRPFTAVASRRTSPSHFLRPRSVDARASWGRKQPRNDQNQTETRRNSYPHSLAGPTSQPNVSSSPSPPFPTPQSPLPLPTLSSLSNFQTSPAREHVQRGAEAIGAAAARCRRRRR